MNQKRYDCRLNWARSSKAMEPDLVVELTKSIERHGAHSVMVKICMAIRRPRSCCQFFVENVEKLAPLDSSQANESLNSTVLLIRHGGSSSQWFIGLLVQSARKTWLYITKWNLHLFLFLTTPFLHTHKNKYKIQILIFFCQGSGERAVRDNQKIIYL